MIKFDFNTMVDSFIDKENFNNLMARKEEVYSSSSSSSSSSFSISSNTT